MEFIREATRLAPARRHHTIQTRSTPEKAGIPQHIMPQAYIFMKCWQRGIPMVARIRGLDLIWRSSQTSLHDQTCRNHPLHPTKSPQFVIRSGIAMDIRRLFNSTNLLDTTRHSISGARAASQCPANHRYRHDHSAVDQELVGTLRASVESMIGLLPFARVHHDLDAPVRTLFF